MPIEERIEVTGADESKRKLDEVSGAQQRVGDSVDQAGNKSEQSAGKTSKLGAAASQMIASFAGLGAVIKLFEQFTASLREALRLQEELASKSAGVADASKLLAEQLGVDEGRGAITLTQLREAGGLTAGAASDFGIAADIGFQGAELGGLLSGENFKTAREIAAFGGAKGLEGAALSSLVSFLQAAGKLGSPEEAKEAIAQIAAAANASRAANVGEFVSQGARGATGQLQAGVPFEDVLVQLVQTRQVEESGELAAQTSNVLEQVAVAGAEPKFTKEIERVATDRGIDPSALTSAQKVGISLDILRGIDSQAEENRIGALLSPERRLRLFKAFRGSNVAATAPAGEAIASATALDFELTVEKGRQGLGFRQRVDEAREDLKDFTTGQQFLEIFSARLRARRRLDREIAQGIVLGVSDENREAEEERNVKIILEEEIGRLRSQGVDTSAAETALGELGFFDTKTGFRDSRLNAVAGEIQEARRGASLGRQAQLKIEINNTTIGTQLNAPDPMFDPPVPIDANQ